MIKISVVTQGQEKTVHFSSDGVVIGEKLQETEASFPLTGRGLKSEHVKIFRQNGVLFALNLANDPFVTLNGRPFYKKEVAGGDTLKIRDIELKIEDPSVSHLQKNEAQELDEEGDLEKEGAFSLPEKPKPFLKNSVEEEVHKNVPMKPRASPFRFLRVATLLLMGLCLIFAIIAVESYLSISNKSEEEELKVAEALADTAMALTYAQLYHISPEKHNWSDPEFIQNNLLAILPTGSLQPIQINSQGELKNCSYILRIYTSSDLTRFLIVAFPKASFSQWIVPKPAILVESNHMELKRVRDLKQLNSILGSLNTYDGIHVSSVSELIKHGEIIPLALLSKKRKIPEFQPPRALAFLRPGAENLVYNAPRYHPFGEALLKKAGQFDPRHISAQELSMLKSELEVLKRLPNLVIYAKDSLPFAQTAINKLKLVDPEIKYLLASIKFDHQGRLRSTKIVIDSEKPEIHPPRPIVTNPSIKEAASFPIEALYTTDLPIGELPESQEIALIEELKPKNPLVERIQAIAQAREEKLKGLHEKVSKAAFVFLKKPSKIAFQKKLERLLVLKSKIDDETKEELFDLAFDFDETETEIIEQHLREAGLKTLWKEAIYAH